MGANYPDRVLLREDGPREGFQMHPDFIATAEKLRLIERLAGTGTTSIEVTSFVRPDRVPQHKDAEDVAAGLPAQSNVRFRALYLNEKGFQRARDCSKLQPEGYLHLAASEAFLKANNNISLDDAIASIDRWIDIFAKSNTPLERIMLSTAFGDHHAGRLDAATVCGVCKKAIDRIEAAGTSLPEMTFADTTGYANPGSVQRLVEQFRSQWPSIEVGLHLHDTRGTGMANVLAGLQCGVTRFDCSVAGLGGCPFTPGAAGNVATEDVAFLCHELGIETGLDLEAYIECAKLAEEVIGHKLPGKLKDGGVI